MSSDLVRTGLSTDLKLAIKQESYRLDARCCKCCTGLRVSDHYWESASGRKRASYQASGAPIFAVEIALVPVGQGREALLKRLVAPTPAGAHIDAAKVKGDFHEPTRAQLHSGRAARRPGRHRTYRRSDQPAVGYMVTRSRPLDVYPAARSEGTNAKLSTR